MFEFLFHILENFKSIFNNYFHPNLKYTLGTEEGGFMYVLPLDTGIGSKARLVSPIQNKTGGSCIHFFYYTDGLILFF